MAKAIEKFTLGEARNIPLDKLVLSQQNVRKIKAGVSIEDLAEDIAHRGLLTSLNVRPELDGDGNETGIYRIPAAERAIAFSNACGTEATDQNRQQSGIVSRGDTQEVENPLAENLQRVSLHPLDQFAFQASSRASARRSLPTMTSLAGTRRVSLGISRPARRPPRRADSIRR